MIILKIWCEGGKKANTKEDREKADITDIHKNIQVVLLFVSFYTFSHLCAWISEKNGKFHQDVRLELCWKN